MKRFCASLEKQIPRPLPSGSIEKQLAAQYTKLWQGTPLVLKQEWDYLQASVILQGLANKQAIEQAYFLFMDEIEQYWNVLDYKERLRIMNIDLKKQYDALPHFTYEDRPYYIPFFDHRLNEIYRQEMIVFERKQYQKLRKAYSESIIDLDSYGTACFDGQFVPAKFLFQDGETAVFYHCGIHKFYIKQPADIMIVPLFDSLVKPFVLQHEQQQAFAALLMKKEVREVLAYGVEQGFYSQSCQATILRQLDRKKLFGLF